MGLGFADVAGTDTFSAVVAALGASCGFSFSGVSDPRSKEQPHSQIPIKASANGCSKIRRNRAKPRLGKGEAIYGSLALVPHR